MRQVDGFAPKIELLIRGKDRLETECGGFISILALVFFLIQAYMLASQLTLQTDPVISAYEVREDPD